MRKNKKSILTRSVAVSAVLVGALLVLDQLTKSWVAGSMELYERKTVIDNFFWIYYIQNTGAGFSMFEDMGIVFFSVLTIGALALLVWYFIKVKSEFTRFSLALIFAGAIGNYIDRLVFGYVRDFLSFNLFGWHFPVFNVADICISVGFVLLVIYYMYDERKHPNAETV